MNFHRLVPKNNALKKLEITLVVFLGLSLLYQLLPDHVVSKVYLSLAAFGFLALFYLIGSYWLFNPHQNRRLFIPITAGIAFSTSLSTLPFNIRLNELDLYFYLPFLNLLFLAGLASFYVYKRKNNPFKRFDKPILVRAILIGMVTSFFAYSPSDFQPYHQAIMILNKDIFRVKGEQTMNYYQNKFEEAYDKDQCDKALEYAGKANTGGKIMVSSIQNSSYHNQQVLDTALKAIGNDTIAVPTRIKHLPDHLPAENFKTIGGIFEDLYFAYRCKAKALYKKKLYSKSLKFHKRAYDGIQAWDPQNDYWKVKRAYALNGMANNYEKLGQGRKADSFYLEAIEWCRKTEDSAKRNLAYFHFKRGDYLQSQYYFKTALKHLERARELIREKGPEANANIPENADIKIHLMLSMTYMKTDSMNKAVQTVKQGYRYSNNKDKNYCKLNSIHGIALLKLNNLHKADSFLRKALSCSKSHPERGKKNFLMSLVPLSRVNMALARYDSARKYLKRSESLLAKMGYKRSSIYVQILNTFGQLEKAVANYDEAKAKYHQAFQKAKAIEEYSQRYVSLLSYMADLYLKLGKTQKARFYADSSLSMAKSKNLFEVPSNAGLINTPAHLNYFIGNLSLADSLYHWALSLQNENDKGSSALANSLNGLGLVYMEREQFQTADSLFDSALNVNKTLFTLNHPYSATIIGNKASLSIKQGAFKRAKGFLDSAFQINKQFFDTNHDVFADIFIDRGNLAYQQNDRGKAETYYRKALTIYRGKFDENHYQVKLAKSKLKRIESGS